MNFINKILKKMNIETVEAHCDIPCGIYDPHLAQIAAHTVIRMAMLIEKLDKSDPEYDLKLSRYVIVKEEHAELVKHEVRIIWGDFFNQSHVEKFPEITNLVWGIMKRASGGKQSTSVNGARELLDAVLKFSEIFWKSKGNTPRIITSQFPSGGDLVLQS